MAIVRTTDGKGRVSLPKAFANSTILIEQLSETELRIRKAVVVAEDEFSEESKIVLSDSDRDLFLSLVDNPPPANKALKNLMKKQE